MDLIQRETMFIDAFINAIHVDYMMQPIMRLVDYVLVQVIGTFTAPPQDVKEHNHMRTSKLQDQKNRDQQRRMRISLLQKEFIKAEILKPTSMNIKVAIKSPVIDVKHHKDVPNFIRVYLGTTQVSNKRSKCP